jgi:hypothetical protein
MANLPALANWEPTRDALHQAAQVLNAIKVPSVARQPNALHHSLNVSASGLNTGELNFGGVMALDFGVQGDLLPDYPQLTWSNGSGEEFAIPLAGYTQITLLDAVVKHLADYGYPVTPRTDEIKGETIFQIHPETATQYAAALDRIYTAMARFRARLLGTMTPLVVWSHHFDLSMLYFVSGSDEHSDPHLNFGFAPESPGIPRPYFYVYAYPMPDGLVNQPLPTPARWHTEGWTGVVLDYDSIVSYGSPEIYIESALLEIQHIFRRAFA